MKSEGINKPRGISGLGRATSMFFFSLSEKRRILVVEDDEIMQRALSISLERAGFKVTSVSTVEEGTRFLIGETYAIVITDLYLPDGDGLDIFRLTREKQPGTPIVGITSYFHTELGQKAKLLFGDRLFEKPFKKNVFIGRIRKFVEESTYRG